MESVSLWESVTQNSTHHRSSRYLHYKPEMCERGSDEKKYMNMNFRYIQSKVYTEKDMHDKL